MDVTTFLNLAAFDQFKLLAGQSGLNNQITGVNILDNPKATDWLSPGELIVTSGYFFKESSEALLHFLESFHRLNIAAVCIKPKIYLTPLPQQLLDLCNEWGIPLIEIPYGVAFSKIMHTVMNLLSDSASETAQIVLDMNAKFMEYSLESEGITYLKQKLEEFLGNPLLITNADWSLLSSTYDDSFADYINQQNSIAYFNQAAQATLPKTIAELKHPTPFVFPNQQSGTVLPIFFNDVTYGYIIVIPKRRPLTHRDYLILENASLAIALKIVHQTEKDRIQNKIRRDFYHEILFGKKSIDELQTLSIDFNYNLSYVVFILSIETKNESKDILQQKYDEDLTMRTILQTALQFQTTQSFDLHLFKQGQKLIGFVGHQETIMTNEDQQQKFFVEFHQYLQTFISKKSQINIFIGSVQNFTHLQQSYKEATQMEEHATDKQHLYFASQFYLENFFSRHIQPNEARQLINYYLEPLLTYDQETDSHLVTTLSVYLQQQQNLAATSRLLFIHRNTLLYRIDKIETLIGYSLNETDRAFQLAFALKLHQQFL